MRSRLLSLSFILFVLFLSTGQAKEKEFLVTKVLDGDTVVLENGDVVRYLGIDAPEMGKKNGGPEFFAREATRFNKQLVLLKKVRLAFDVEKKDSHGRVLAYVYVKNTFVNGELVRLGYARAMIKPPNLAHKDLLVRHQKDAMAKDAGVWQEKKRETEPYYIGNKRTYTIHKPSCELSSKISEKNRIIFRSRVDPIRIGYTPCKRCKP